MNIGQVRVYRIGNTSEGEEDADLVALSLTKKLSHLIFPLERKEVTHGNNTHGSEEFWTQDPGLFSVSCHIGGTVDEKVMELLAHPNMLQASI